VYDGADAVMLSAESASGKHPREAVSMMSRIIEQVEADPAYRQVINASYAAPEPGHAGIAEAICGSVRCAVAMLHAAALVCYTRSGHTSLHAARERPECPVLSLTPNEHTARRLAVVWGIHSVQIGGVSNVNEMTEVACEAARREGFAQPGQIIVAIAGLPFGSATTTNLMRIATA
jgi:pyruvate kinase